MVMHDKNQTILISISILSLGGSTNGGGVEGVIFFYGRRRRTIDLALSAHAQKSRSDYHIADDHYGDEDQIEEAK